jgi:phage shock protein PspC (stress-responsive transcriptional regulator)
VHLTHLSGSEANMSNEIPPPDPPEDPRPRDEEPTAESAPRPRAGEPAGEQPPPEGAPRPQDQERPTTDQPTTDQPTTEQPTTEQPDGEQPTTEQPDGEQPTAAQPTSAAPRRLYRSRTDRMLGGVCGGLAAYLRVDAVIVRVVAVALVFAGGAGIFLYLAALLLVPDEGEGEGAPEGPRRGAAVTGAVLLIVAIGILLPFHGGWWGGWWIVPLGLIGLAGLLVWRLASGERHPGDARAILRAAGLGVALLVVCFGLALGAAWAAAAGGSEVVAGIVIAAGIALVAGAFLGRGARWLILPALAIALPAGVVQAADIDVHGGVGERTYRPTTAADVRDHYRLGVGRLVVDLRGADLPPGDRHIRLNVGVGAAELVVPRNVCVASAAHSGVGGAWVFDRHNAGVDVDWDDQRLAKPGNPRVVIDGDVGIGALLVNHTGDDHDFGRHFDARDPFNRNAACL